MLNLMTMGDLHDRLAELIAMDPELRSMPALVRVCDDDGDFTTGGLYDVTADPCNDDVAIVLEGEADAAQFDNVDLQPMEH